MSEKSKIPCPLCNRAFTPSNDLITFNLLVSGVILAYKIMQEKANHDDKYTNPLPCCRCGQYRMHPIVARNALSRHENIFVCDVCGIDEAMRVFCDSVLPTSQWWVCNEILSIDADHSNDDTGDNME